MVDRCGNPLLREWVKEWMDKSKELSSKSYYTYKKAYDSLSKCPVQFSHPSEAICLSGIGEKMVQRFEENMRKYCRDNGLTMPARPYRKGKRRLDSLNGDPEEESSTQSRPRAKTNKPYIPGYRTGGYGILCALLDFKKLNRDQVTREQICAVAQDYCDSSYTLMDSGKSYTAWSSINTLCNKGYVWKNGKPAKYALTDTGLEIAEKLKQVNTPSSSQSGALSGSQIPPADSQRELSPDEIDLHQLLAESSTQGSRLKPKNRRSAGKSTGAMLDQLLAEMGGNQSSGPDLSLYVLDPSKHQSISLNGVTKINENHRPANTVSINDSNIEPRDPYLTSTIPNSIPTSSFVPQSTSSLPTQSTLQESRLEDLTSSSYSQKHILHLPKPVDRTTTIKRHYNIDCFELDDDITPSLPKLQTSSHPGEPDIVDLLSSPEASPVIKEPEFDLFEQDLTGDFFPMSQARRERIVSETFHFTYLDILKTPVRHATMADTQTIEGKKSYLIRYNTQQADHPKAQSVRQQILEGPTTTGYLLEDDMEPICPGLPARPVLPLHDEESPEAFWPKDKPLSIATSPLLFHDSSQASPLTFNTPLSSQAAASPITFGTSSQVSAFSDTQVTNYEAMIERESCDVMLPHEYEILLVLDTREIQMKSNREYFQERLTSKGIRCVTRALDMGDVLWIAKKKNSREPMDELVLDYVLERKRLDDLVSSIKDGRFVEQKTRLKRSGVDKVIYVVEEYGREDAERFGAQAIQTALSSTQMVDGIFLKRTGNVDETVDYLVSVTHLIERIYQDTTLYSIPSHLVSRDNYLELKAAYKRQQQLKTSYLVTYPVFNQLNAKGGSTTVHDVFLRMLMTIRGVNAEKALSLMKVYPTPHALLKAFDGLSVDEAKKVAKNATASHIFRRRWGSALSEKLYQTWAAVAYPNVSDDSDHDFES